MSWVAMEGDDMVFEDGCVGVGTEVAVVPVAVSVVVGGKVVTGVCVEIGTKVAVAPDMPIITTAI
jgi:hypothetical protein